MMKLPKESRRCDPVICGLILLMAVIAGCSGGRSQSDKDREDSVTPAVEAVKANYGSLPLSERLSGTVEAENQVILTPEISAPIEKVYVHDGEQVQKGDPLVKLKDDQYRDQYQQARASIDISRAQLKQVQSQLKKLKAQFKRLKTLYEKNLSSEQEYENIQSQVESAQADVELAQARVQQNKATMHQQQTLLAETTLRAPISGTVGQRNAEVGMRVGPDTQLFTIGNLDQVKVNVVLTDKMLQQVEVGQQANVYVQNATEAGQDTTRHVIRAKVARISPFLNDVTRSTQAEIEVQNEKHLLKPGMFIPVDIMYGNSRQTTLVPTSALFTNPNSGTEGIYVASSLGVEVQPADTVNPDDPPPLTEPIQVTFKPVDVIARGRMKVGVSGISPGQWVITVGQDLLSEGHSQARVRAVSWNRVFSLQRMQGQDLLKKVLDEQNNNAQNPS